MAPLSQFILLGDSLTQLANAPTENFSLVAQLQEAYVRRLDVINRGFSGYNTDHILLALKDILPTVQQASVRFLLVWLGVNDSNTLVTCSIPQHVTVDNFKFNLNDIISNRLVTAHSPNIILMTPPPVEETLLHENGPRNAAGEPDQARSAEGAKLYADAVKQVGVITGVPVVDVWSRFMREAGWEEGKSLPGSKELGKDENLAGLLSDGLHLTSKGYQIVWEELLKVLKEKFPEYPPYKMPYKVKVPWETSRGKQHWDVDNEW